MKEQLKNLLKQGYTIKIYNMFYNYCDIYESRELLIIKDTGAALYDINNKKYNIYNKSNIIIDDIIEKTFYNIKQYSFIYYHKNYINKTVTLKFKSLN